MKWWPFSGEPLFTFNRSAFYSTPGSRNVNTSANSKRTVKSSSIDTDESQPPQSKTSTPRAAKTTLRMAPRTIAERAAAGEIQSIEGLSRVEQGQLLVWAREQGIEYSEIIRRYGFTQTSEGLRTWHRNIVLDRPERVPRITDTDVSLLTLCPRTTPTTSPTISTIQRVTQGKKLTLYSIL